MPSAWTAADLDDPARWLVVLGRDEREALRTLADNRLGPQQIGVLDRLQELVRSRLDDGIGMVLLRGARVDLPVADIEAMLCAWGSTLGTLLPQDREGSLVGRVYDARSATPRGAQTNRDLVYHTDFAAAIPDTFALLTVRAAREGGESQVVSGHTALNALIERGNDVTRLFGEYAFDRSGDIAPGDDPVFRAPVFAYSDDKLSICYNRARIHRGHRVIGEPLQEEDVAPLDALDQVLADPRNTLTFTMEPGDLLVANNDVVLHNRSAFVDHDSPERRRLLLRLWIVRHESSRNSR